MEVAALRTRTLMELYKFKKAENHVYLWIGGHDVFEHFLNNARKEGFKLSGNYDDVFALENMSFCHPGLYGHMAFSSSPQKNIVRIDYLKWISGAKDYKIKIKNK